MAVDSQDNFWFGRQKDLSNAFLRELGTVRAAVRTEMVTRALALNLPAGGGTVLDVGGGGGILAIRLASLGHQVVVADPDPVMLEAARYLTSFQPEKVRNLIQFFECSVESIEFDSFDLVCCHSVLIYLHSTDRILQEMARATRPGGLISIVSLNHRAISFRSGIGRRWKEAYADLVSGTQTGEMYARVRVHPIQEIQQVLEAQEFSQFCWRGIGVFSDHLEDSWSEPDMGTLYELEWLAGAQDPYRQIARNYHLIARKSFIKHNLA